jgi:tetratricopeptide (TPR) repeat protein
MSPTLTRGNGLPWAAGPPPVLGLLPFVFAFLVWLVLAGDPLVLAPQLDAAENLALARQIETGQLPQEPFYRSPVYPGLLSLLHPVGMRPFLGSLLGIACHLLNGGLIWLIARRLQLREWGCFLGAALYLLNPASLFYASLLLDITPAISAFLGALFFLFAGTGPRPLAAGTLLTLAALLRPHFLPVAVLGPVLLVLAAPPFRWRHLLAWVPLAAGLLAFGLANWLQAGQFRMLPWQGSFNLYAANHADANGLYFEQSIDLPQRTDAVNPARLESMVRYAAAHPEAEPPFSITEMNHFWRDQFIARLGKEPKEIIALWAYKAYAILNSWEQYNNYSFPFHRDRILPLKLNPLNWGWLLLIGAAGMVGLAGRRPNAARSLLFVIALLAAMLLLFYASARFRLLLVPMAALAAAGLPETLRSCKGSARRASGLALALLLLGTATFSSFAGIRSKATFPQDRLLLANAHARLGNDAASARWAREVLRNQPRRREARRNYTIAYLNLALQEDPERRTFGDWNDQRFLQPLEPLPHDPGLTAAYGILLYQWGEYERALEFWKSSIRSAGKAPHGSHLAKACLHMVNPDGFPAPPEPAPLLERLRENLTAPPGS